MKEFNKNVEIISYTLEEVKEKDLGLKIYKKMVEDLSEYLKIQDGVKREVLDMFSQESYVKENTSDWMNYKSLDIVPSYKRGNENIVVDINADPNNIPVKDNEFDIVFTVGNKFGYGIYHNSIFEVERIIKPGGYLICGLSKYWFYKEFNQLLLGYRNWLYLRAIEINYKIVETKVESAKFFAYYKFKG